MVGQIIYKNESKVVLTLYEPRGIEGLTLELEEPGSMEYISSMQTNLSISDLKSLSLSIIGFLSVQSKEPK